MSELPSETLSYRTVVAEYFLGLRGSGLLLSPLDEDLVAEWERRGLPLAVVCRGLRRGLEQQLEERGGDRTRLPRSLRAYRFAVEDEWHAYRQGRVGQAPEAGSEDLMARERLAAARRHLEEAAAVDATWRDAYLAAAAALDTEAENGRAEEDAAPEHGSHGFRNGRVGVCPPPPGSTEQSQDLMAVIARVDPVPVPGPESDWCPHGSNSGTGAGTGSLRLTTAITLAWVERALAAADEVLIGAWLAAMPRDQRSAIGPRLRGQAGPRPRRTRPRSYRQTLRSYLLDAARRAGLRCLRGSV